MESDRAETNSSHKRRYTISLNRKNPLEALLITALGNQENSAGFIKLALAEKVLGTRETVDHSATNNRGHAETSINNGIGDFGGAL